MSTQLLPLTVVVAIARNGAIGRSGQLPWEKSSEDMQWFKHVTHGHAVIMGRKTWESLPAANKPLAKRFNVVLSHDNHVVFPGAATAVSFDNALQLARCIDNEPCVIGGAEIYKLAMPHATKVCLTEIDETPTDADTFFALDRTQFHETSRMKGVDPRLSFVVLERS